MSELRAFWLLVTGFFVVINTIYLIQLVLAVVAVRRRMRALALEDYRDMEARRSLSVPSTVSAWGMLEPRTTICRRREQSR